MDNNNLNFPNQTDEAVDIRVLKRLIPYLKRYHLTIAGGFFAIVIASAVGLSVGQGIKVMLDTAFADGANTIKLLNWFFAGALAAISIWGIANFFRGYCMQRVALRVRDDIRRDAFKNLTRMQPAFIEKHSSGQIQTRLIADTMELGGFLTGVLPVILGSSLMLVGAVIAAFYVNTKMSLLVLAALPFVFLPFVIFGKALQRRGAEVQQANANAGRFAGEILRGIKVVQAYNQEKKERTRFGRYVNDVFRHAMRAIRLEIGINSITMVIALSGISALLWVGAKDIVAGNMTVGELFAFAFYANLIVGAAGGLVAAISSANVAAGAIDRLAKFTDAETPVKEAENPARFEKPIRGELKLDNVRFSYPARPDVPAIDGVALTVEAGSRVAIVGASGAGKSTLFDLILRFYDPTSGSINLDGVDLRQISLADLRKQIGFVPQDDTLSSSDVITNIRYGVSDASEEEVIACAKRAFAHDFVKALPEGYQTDLGEVGARLSGGQKQRISLARALLLDPPILLLDEATNALDAESEHHVQIALDEVAKGRTTIMIAHRLSTVLKADKIFVLDEGRVVAAGSHEELLTSSPYYKRLATLQLAEPPDAMESNSVAV